MRRGLDHILTNPAKPRVERRRVRYRAAEDHVLAAAKLLDESPGDREIDELLGIVMAKLMARGKRTP